ncbi:MAG TPA: serine/threonine-protein kinase [Planctomycetaceae bacterium]|jgi:serine/threonine protein kinase|nr:serine/threonine-protein kinase [Planctomycetaceae bacterium]
MDASRADASDPSPATTVVGPDPFQQIGAVIGPYKLIEQIGQGGFGLVFLAEQQKPVRRRVAVKVIKPGMDSHDVIARFEAERQAVALMDHPNIARVFDAGTTDSGRPYFVMEFVRGVAITEFCDQNHLTPRERLELFVSVCQAVQHAHQKGIIHRDIKPSNVLVMLQDGKPVPKVIDFGVAKALHQQLTDKTVYTRFAQMIGTPLYMSPEQAQLSGIDIDTRSDIYSLGVLLYELLTGTTPFDRKRLAGAAYDEVIRIIRDEEPPRPSTRLGQSIDSLQAIAAQRRTEPARLSRMFRGDLDWITMKALEKDRARRYETANGLARDIERYLNDEVVEARPPSAGYRIKKFARRHRGQVVGGSVIFLALAGALAAVVAVQSAANDRLSASLDRETRTNDELNRSRAAVQARYDLALDAIKAIHTGDSEELLLKEERFKELRDRRLKSAADFYGKLSALLGQETDAASRRALTDSNFALAELTSKVGGSENALKAHRAVLAARETLAAEPGADAHSKVDVGRSLTEVASLLASTGRSDDALAAYRRSESILAELVDSDPAARAALAACRSGIGQLLFTMNKKDEALAAFGKARADQEMLSLAPAASPNIRRDLGDTVGRIAFLRWFWSDLSGAEADYRAAVGIWLKLTEENPASTDFRYNLARNRFGLAGVLEFAGSLSESEAEYRMGLGMMRNLVDENPAVTQFRGGLTFGQGGLGKLLSETGRLTEAEVQYRAGLAIVQKVVEENPASVQFRRSLAIERHNLGTLLLQTARPEEAEVECRASVSIMQKLADDNPTVTVFRDTLPHCLKALGDVLRSRGRAAEAVELYERTIAVAEPEVRKYPTDPEYVYCLVVPLWRRGLARRDLGDLAGAVTDIRRALQLGKGLPQYYVRYVFERACSHAALAGLAERPGSGVSGLEGRAAATEAMKWLNRLAATGYRNVNELRIESAFDALRGREDYRKLMAELELEISPARPVQKKATSRGILPNRAALSPDTGK